MAYELSLDIGAVPRKLTRSRWLSGLVGIAVVVAWGFFLRSQLDALRAYQWHVAPLPFAVSIAWGACYFASLALCWALLLRSVDTAAQPVSLAAAARVWLASMMTRYIPGNVWHILSRVALAGELRVSRTHVLTSATIEQVLTLLGALALFGVTLPFWLVRDGVQLWLLWLLPLGLVALHPQILGRMLGWAATRLRRPELVWRYTYGEMLVVLAAFVGANLCAGFALAATLWGLTSVQPLDLPLIIGASAFAWVAGYLSFLTPSGLGVREGVLTTLLALVYPLPVAIVASLLFRVAATLGELLAVGSAWGYGRFGVRWRAVRRSPHD